MLVGAVLLAGCGASPPRPPEPGALSHYTVKPGDTLYSIAFHYGYDYRQVAAWNDIEPPYEIYPGDRLVIVTPHYNHWLEESDARFTPAPAQPKRKARSEPSRPPRSKPEPAPERTAQKRPERRKKPAATERGDPPDSWHWPTEGRVVQRFNPGKGKKGVDIGGSAGQAVRAAAGGQVVYSGDGLIGYGNLVIIKHDRTFLSAYGHNRKLLVEEGERVKPRQRIAEMGQSGKTESILHFEIRRRGKPVDPLEYLPHKK
ncbi:MAG TPA: peptidoglycan DD-metalloendopeptidase family protein [Gammaproteobacteria bacterium]|nr:peptidoglycan DD-metalloendopeptidase family protein [Gammaproteobacteria bacterium]